jgi:hypothetical protein
MAHVCFVEGLFWRAISRSSATFNSPVPKVEGRSVWQYFEETKLLPFMGDQVE